MFFPLCPADVRLRKLAEEKDELLAQIRKLKNQLEEERQKHSKVDSSYTDGEGMENGTDLHLIEMQSKLTSRTAKSTLEPQARVFSASSVSVFVRRRRKQANERIQVQALQGRAGNRYNGTKCKLSKV